MRSTTNSVFVFIQVFSVKREEVTETYDFVPACTQNFIPKRKNRDANLLAFSSEKQSLKFENRCHIVATGHDSLDSCLGAAIDTKCWRTSGSPTSLGSL